MVNMFAPYTDCMHSDKVYCTLVDYNYGIIIIDCLLFNITVDIPQEASGCHA